MIVSEARTDASRRDPLRAPGLGEIPSRADALETSLRSSAVVPEDLQAIQDRANDWYYTLTPQNYFQRWVADQVAVLSLRLDRSERIERRLRDRASLRAELCWDDDRRLDAEVLGGQLARRPAEVVEQLRRTPQGCEWLMGRWAMLARVADLDGAWTAEQTRLAFDLLGTPPEFRVGRPGDSVDFHGRVVAEAEGLADVARREVDALIGRRDDVARLDAVDRALTRADLDDSSPEIRRHRRHEATLHRRLSWCLAQLKDPSPRRQPHPGLQPNWAASPEPEAEPEPEATPSGPPHPPFDLEPSECPEPGQEVDLPKIIAGRLDRRHRRAEARREARRRKLERLRA